MARAAGVTIAIEPENGVTVSPADIIASSSASNGWYVKFGPAVATPTPTPTPAPTATPTPAPGPVATISMVSWNVGVDNPRNVGDEVIDFMRFADIMGIQELTNGTSEMDAVKSKVICSSCAYDSTNTTHTYDASSPNKEMIMWKKAVFTKLATGVVDVSPRTSVEGGEVVAPRFINWAKLQHKASGKQFYVMNQHVVSGVESGGRPDTSVPKRLALYRTHMDKLSSLITSKKADNVPIFSLGDFNVDYRDDHVIKDPMFPYARMATVGVKSSYEALNLAGIASGQGTRPVSDRLIDYVWHWVRSNVVAISESISASTHGSDHYGYYSTLEIR
jgi:endonuclease/exonuclease/phosphatase family metal-dependent hydrolase